MNATLHTSPLIIHIQRSLHHETSKCTITKGDKTEDLSKLMKLMGMGIKCGDTVEVTIDGADEDVAAETIEKFFKENL